MKVLFDTNVYISESLVGGLAERILDTVADARWRIFVSPYLLDEAERVLTEKLGFSARFSATARQRIRRRAEPVDVTPSRHQVAADPKDSPIIQAAITSGVDYLVSDDRHLLSLHPYEGIRIVSMRDFAAVLQAEGLM